MSVYERPRDEPASLERVGVVVVPAPEPPGVEIIDPIERHRVTLTTPESTALRPADPDRFRFPVDQAVAITTDAVRFPREVVYVRDADGAMVAEPGPFAPETFPEDAYTVEICSSIKLYLRVESALAVRADQETVRLEFGEERDVLVGARSHHTRPATTVTTTGDPTDVMAAVSTFGSALKTTSPERAFPTLRGHPPLVEIGDDLSIPSGLAPPDTGVRLELPATLRHVFVGAPLAYYLGAEVVPGDVPRLTTDRGLSHRLDGDDGFHDSVERLLKQTFFLDCIARTEGHYRVDLHERRAVGSSLDLDPATVYDQPLARRLETYLDVPFGAIESHVPTWRRTAYVEPALESVELLPYLVDDLSLVCPQRGERISREDLEAASVDSFMEDGMRRSTTGTIPAGLDSFVKPEPTDSFEQAWAGDEAPLDGSMVTVEAFEHRLDREPTTGDIDITVVCNDAAMEDERASVDEVYGSREELPFDVTVHEHLTVEELRTVLRTPTDFLHYIGHIDGDGFECTDGKLDAAEIDSVGVDAFLLNACQSYAQGMRLVRSGSIGGVVTLSEVINSGAIRIGKTLARLLNKGFPLYAALDIAKDLSIIGGLYAIAGDGGLTLTQTESLPFLFSIDTSSAELEFEVMAYPNTWRDLGSLAKPYLETPNDYFLVSNRLSVTGLDPDGLSDLFSLEDLPLRVDGSLRWTGDVTVNELI